MGEKLIELSDEPPVVLIVEDERGLADLYERILQDTYRVRTAYTGEQALDQLDVDVDIVLLDRRLGNWSGRHLLPVIEERNIDCMVAMVTAVRPDFDIVDLPIDEYLMKPVSRQDLLDTVEELLLWQTTDVDKQELLALISRKIALEKEKDSLELVESEEYAELKRRVEIATERHSPDAILENPSKYRPGVCPECRLRWDISVGDTTGFVRLGSHVWKCTRCGNIESGRQASDRRVVRR